MINPSDICLDSLPSVPLSDRGSLPGVPCIYFAIDAQGVIQYIGRSANPQQRWMNHHRYPCLSKMNGIRIAYLTIESGLLCEVEEALIQWFQPALNGSRVESGNNFLYDRMKQLGWSRYKLTQEFCRVRGELPTPVTVKRFETTVARALVNPKRSSLGTVQTLVKALDGEQYIRWNKREEVVTGHEDIKVD